MQGIKKLGWGFAVFSVIAFAAVLAFNTSTHAQGMGADPEISAKLEQVLEGQKIILQELRAMKQQLNTIELYTNKL
ncbi:MAG: hypothetical protein PHD09_07830 [Candidatus Omnitrophica bacterium]|nr:hypothetical protein [Candidatus Omnitrophota bacterium]